MVITEAIFFEFLRRSGNINLLVITAVVKLFLSMLFRQMDMINMTHCGRPQPAECSFLQT